MQYSRSKSTDSIWETEVGFWLFYAENPQAGKPFDREIAD